MNYVVKRIRSYVSTNKYAFEKSECIGRFDHELVYEYDNKVDDDIIYMTDNLDTAVKFCNDYMFGNFVNLYTYDNVACERDMLYVYECDENGNITNICNNDFYQDIIVRDIEEKYN